MDNQDKPKGFKGLSKLVSDLSDLSWSETSKGEVLPLSEGPEKAATSTSSQAGSHEQAGGGQESNTNSEDSLGTSALAIFGFVVLLIIGVVVSGHQDRQKAKSVASVSASSSQSILVEQDSQEQDASKSGGDSEKNLDEVQVDDSAQTNSTPVTTFRFSTEVPPVGTNHIHSISEIRWCLKEGIRIDAVRDLNNTQAGISQFNRWVDDYNSRCGSYRYREGNLSSAKRDVEPYRAQIREDAREDAATEQKQETASLTKKIQLALQSLGYEPGPADGIYGSNTAGAIKQYQREVNLLVTGEVSEELLEQLKFTKAMR